MRGKLVWIASGNFSGLPIIGRIIGDGGRDSWDERHLATDRYRSRLNGLIGIDFDGVA